MDPQTIQTVASAISSVAATISLVALYFSVTDRRTDHDRSRRERAVELVRFWATALTRRAAITKKFVERLDDDQTRSLWKMEAFSVSENLEALLRGCLPADLELGLEKTENKTVKLSQEVVAILRWEMVTYLNQLESILMAWRHNIADKDLLEEQFRYLVKPQDGSYLLERFRVAAGGASSWPAVQEFARVIRERSEMQSPGKPAVS